MIIIPTFVIIIIIIHVVMAIQQKKSNKNIFKTGICLFF